MWMEFEQESQATRRLLERVPEDKLGWKPHPKSMTLGQLALHVATSPRGSLQILSGPEFDLATMDMKAAQPGSRAELMAEFENVLGEARKELGSYDEARTTASWRLRKGPQVLMEAPRVALLRSLFCNHLYHHRGQLTVYLRLLDVPVPSVYGPSADENPFA
jgi:uncharacterized damage-inducible protein DinB